MKTVFRLAAARRAGVVCTALAAGALVCIFTFVPRARTYIPHFDALSHAAPPSAESGTGGSVVVDQPPGGPAQTVRFTLYDVTIQPREARVQKGRVILFLEDMTGASTGLVIEREVGGSRALAGRVERADRTRGKGELRLGPGTYRVYDSSRPESQATLIVEP